jgi:hypothetical protein
MHPTLNIYLANALAADRLREAECFRRSRVEWSEEPDRYDAVTVRFARPSDAEAVLRLSELDGRRVSPRDQMLVAEVEGRVLAARPLEGGSSIADPFRPTAHLVELLELRSAHLRNGRGGSDGGRFHRGRARGWLRSVLATSRS